MCFFLCRVFFFFFFLFKYNHVRKETIIIKFIGWIMFDVSVTRLYRDSKLYIYMRANDKYLNAKR